MRMPIPEIGLIAAACTPFDDRGRLNTDRIPPMVDHLLEMGVSGFYVCGTTGEGASLTGQERREVASAFVEAVRGRLPVLVQVGHNSLLEACGLAEHAAACGATAISANAPSYFRVSKTETLVGCMAEVAASAPRLPFYYYHIPELTGCTVSMVDFLQHAPEAIPNFAGLKYSSPTVHEFQRLLAAHGSQFDFLWGCDEMLLSALVVGARGAVGSTYNIAAPLFRGIIEAWSDGEVERARGLQELAVEMVAALERRPFHPALKEVLKIQGLDCGACRMPLRTLDALEVESLKADLEVIGFFRWACSKESVDRLVIT